MQNLSAAHRQISASTIGRYRAMATPYRDGTWNYDVGLIHRDAARCHHGSPAVSHPRSRLRPRARSRDLPRSWTHGRRAQQLPGVRGHGARGVRLRSLAAGPAGALSEQIGLRRARALRSLGECAVPSATSTAHPRSSASPSQRFQAETRGRPGRVASACGLRSLAPGVLETSSH